MGIITGYICAILLIVLLIKFLARKCKWTRLNKALMKSHKYIAFLFLAISVVHLILVIPVLEGRHIFVTVSGIVILVVGLLLTIICHVMKDKKKEVKIHRLLSVVMALMLVGHIAVYLVDLVSYYKAVEEISISEIDLQNVKDGEYYGEYSTGYVAAKVKVTVDNKAITKVELIKHVTERGQKAEVLIDTIKEKQSVKVDAISGATNSSKVIMKACENALNK